MFTKNKHISKVAFTGLAFAALALFGTSAFAQSSGNFTAKVQTTQCTINTLPGQNGGSLNNNNGGPLLSTYIKTPNSAYTTLLIRPSLVTGLFNNTQITGAMETSANSAAVRVVVTLDGNPVLPATPAQPGIIYDERFQQLSSNVFDSISGCSMSNNCNIDLVTSTLAAHSFDFVATNVGGGTHQVVVRWEFQCTSNGAPTDCTA